MSSPPAQPHLVSLVLQSKKALQHGEHLCSRAHAVSNTSIHASVEVVALNAKVCWVRDAIGEQLELVAGVAKCIEEKRANLRKQVQAWDNLRTKHSGALDDILELLGSQHVPPDFHQTTSVDSSLFGSQHSDEGPEKPTDSGRPGSLISHSPSSTLRQGLLKGKPVEKEKHEPKLRSSWKTLRDFVDDQAIEDVLETIENDRLTIDDNMEKTDAYPETLANTIDSIRGSIPEIEEHPLKAVEDVLAAQDVISTAMAQHLESLTSHYGQMANALQESEAGEAFSEEDLRDMNRDTEELPSIMAELEESADVIEEQHAKLLTAQDISRTHLSVLGHILDDLDELGIIMEEMLQTQDEVQVKCEEELNGLHDQLLSLEHLRDRYVSYQLAFNKLILELLRRRQYREAAESIVRNMTTQLQAMSEEEDQVRKHFNLEFGANLPDDLCHCIENSPTRWEVVPGSGDAWEFLPTIENDLISEARDHINSVLRQEAGFISLRNESP